MDSPAALMPPESPKSPQQPNLLWTPEIDATIEQWRQTGVWPFDHLQVYPQPQWRIFPKTDLRLVHHVATISNEMFSHQTSKLTLWTDMMPKFLSIAASHPFVMHSILAFSASHLAWISQSSETRNLAFHHAGIALKGLHEGIANFTKVNSDAARLGFFGDRYENGKLQYTGTTIRTNAVQVIQAMHSWRHESMFAEYIAEQTPLPGKSFMNQNYSPVSSETRREHLTILSDIQSSLARLQPYLSLSRHEQEGKWVEQLRNYIERLRASGAAQTAEEQFGQLYALRKWLFWVPISLLAAKHTDATVMVVLAHFYAAALALEPMFPEIGAIFCANLSLGPLEGIVPIAQGYQNPSYDDRTQSVSYLIQYPNDVATSYRARRDWMRQQAGEGSPLPQTPYGLEALNMDLQNLAQYSYGQSTSPAFAPSPLNFFPASTLPGLASGPTSPYLEVPHIPRTSVDLSYSSPSYTTPLGSPATGPYSVPEQPHPFSFGMPPMGYHPSGFVTAPTQIWT
ncbi:hypothetical protein SLS60_011412 [Paraconiothyrium brasiliense]|uniref:Uncharacterized protein n=1 Tax=Paraconiothyrium brasiliense TaxID=300254 RepID=A0ABR3QK82_9PLEO